MKQAARRPRGGQERAAGKRNSRRRQNAARKTCSIPRAAAGRRPSRERRSSHRRANQSRLHQIHAPARWHRGRTPGPAGQLLSPGAQILTFVAETKWVQANYRETQLTHMKVGRSSADPDGLHPGRIFRGKVSILHPASGSQFALLPPDNATGNFTKVVQRVPVKIVFDDPSRAAEALQPGLSVVAKFESGSLRTRIRTWLPLPHCHSRFQRDKSPTSWRARCLQQFSKAPVLGILGVVMGAGIVTLVGRLLTLGTADLKGSLGLESMTVHGSAARSTSRSCSSALLRSIFGGLLGPRRVLLFAATASR